MTDFLTRFFGNAFLFPVLVFLTAAMAAVFSVYLLCVKESNTEKLEKISRWKIPGMILGVFVLAWCIPHAMPILPVSLHKFLFPLLVAAVVCAWFTLDHLFSRALGGYMILTAHMFLRETYAFDGFGTPVHAVFFLIYGTMGIYLCGLPYRLRDLIRLEQKRGIRWIFPVYFLLFAAILLSTGIRYLRYFS